MKFVTSFFNAHTLRKDITRFCPAWLIYFIGEALLSFALFSSRNPAQVARQVAVSLPLFSVVNIVYACLVAQLLFGELFNSRLCNGLHAMPLRRSQRFNSHVLSGLLFSIVPNALAIVLLMPRMNELWFIGLLWLLGMTLEYLFFFGLAVFSVFCTGSRFAMASVYVLLNFGAVLAGAFFTAVYEPLLFGIPFDMSLLFEFSPICSLLGNLNRSYIEMGRAVSGSLSHPYTFQGFGSGWTYLCILAAVGVVLLILSLLMYRRRALETAGDFAAVRPLSPVFSVVCTLAVGLLFGSLGEIIARSMFIGFFLIGIVVGYFVGQFLLKRTVKVFKLKAFLKCGAIVAAFLISIFLTQLDPLGITRYVPDPSQTAQVQIKMPYNYSGTDYWCTVDTPSDIAQIANAHREIIADRAESDGHTPAMLHLRYTMKNGTVTERIYPIYPAANEYHTFIKFLSAPEYILQNFISQPGIVSITTRINHGKQLTAAQTASLWEALTADCKAGKMVQHQAFHSDGFIATVNLYLFNVDDGSSFSHTIYVYKDATQTMAWLLKNGFNP